MSEKTINISLTANQIDVLRGVLYEYYSENNSYTDAEEVVRQQLESILADAEDALHFANYKREKYLNGV